MASKWPPKNFAMLRDGMLATILFVASIVLVIGWALGFDAITRLASGLAAMVPSTALCFICLSGVLIGPVARVQTRASKLILRLAGASVALTATVNLAIVASGRAGGIDALLFPHFSGRPQDAMAVATALSFVCSATCVVLLSYPDRPVERLFTPLASTCLALCSIALVGYLLDSAALYQFFIFTATALHTALLFLLLVFALMLSNPRRGWIWLLLGKGVGSAGARRLFPVVVAGPLLLIMVALAATRVDWLSPDFRASLLAIAMISGGLWAILRNAKIENEVQRELSGLITQLEGVVADKDLLLREMYHRVNNNLQQINALIAIEGAACDGAYVGSSFESLSRRVKAIGMVHQMLMRTARQSEIELTTFLDQLRGFIVESHHLEGRGIRLTAHAQAEHLHIDTAISVGLILNELVSNAIEHAFIGGTTGSIAISVAVDPADATMRIMTVCDDGKGGDLAESSSDRSGMQIVRGLVLQLRGTMAVHNVDGTTVVIRFQHK